MRRYKGFICGYWEWKQFLSGAASACFTFFHVSIFHVAELKFRDEKGKKILLISFLLYEDKQTSTECWTDYTLQFLP